MAGAPESSVVLRRREALPMADSVVRSSDGAATARSAHGGPHRLRTLVLADAPFVGERADDAQPAAARHPDRGRRRHGRGVATAVGDLELDDLAAKYRSGELLTGEMKQRCIAELQKFVAAFQERRSKIDDEAMRNFMRPKKLEYVGNPNPTKPVPAAPAAAAAGEGGEAAVREDGRGTKGERKAAKIAAQKAEKLALREKKEAEEKEKKDEAAA